MAIVASFEVPDSTGAEVATWAGHTWQQSRRGFGSCSHEGFAIGAGHRRSGRQRISRSTVVVWCSPGSPSRSAPAAVGSSSRRVPSFHRTFSKSVDSFGVRTCRGTEGARLCTGAVDEIARGDGQSSIARANAASCIATAARSFNGRNTSVESTSRRVGGGKGRAPQEACKIPVGPCSRFARGVVPEHRPVAASFPGQIRVDGHFDRERRHSRRKFESFQPFGMKRQAVVGSQGSVTRSVGARYGLRGTRVGEASQPAPPSLSRHRSVRLPKSL